MGSHPNIDHVKYPKQSEWCGPGTRVSICFNYDSSHQVSGKVIRNDAEEPGEMIFMLDDERVIRSVECMWHPEEED